MAFGQQQIFPIDFNKSAAVGVNLPFSGPMGVSNSAISGSNLLFNPSNKINTPFSSNYTTAAAIKNNLINYFLTNPGERPLNPQFGAGLRSFIFEQLTDDNLDFLESRIQQNLETFFSNINILNLEINKTNDSQTINVVLKYSVNQTNITDTLNMNFT
jgi:phage baseplate assembly protein W